MSHLVTALVEGKTIVSTAVGGDYLPYWLTNSTFDDERCVIAYCSVYPHIQAIVFGASLANGGTPSLDVHTAVVTLEQCQSTTAHSTARGDCQASQELGARPTIGR